VPVEAFDAAMFEADGCRILEQDLDISAIEALADARRSGAGGASLESVGGATTDDPNPLAEEALAAFSRRPLLQRLVALQDATADPAEGESIGRMLSLYNSGVLEPRSDGGVELESNLTFSDLEEKYKALYATCTIRPERAGEVAWHRKKLVQYRPRYEAVQAKTGVPWWFVGVVHALEASFSFFGHLHNGDPLTARTVQVPRNRPEHWNPPNDWESSALDSLAYEGLVGLTDWNVARALHRWENYNGFGYYAKGINSPYLWSFSNHYTKGKFVADHKFNPDAVSKQCGAAVMLKALELAGLVDLRSS
jgi:lysozyme family protein